MLFPIAYNDVCVCSMLLWGFSKWNKAPLPNYTAAQAHTSELTFIGILAFFSGKGSSPTHTGTLIPSLLVKRTELLGTNKHRVHLMPIRLQQKFSELRPESTLGAWSLARTMLLALPDVECLKVRLLCILSTMVLSVMTFNLEPSFQTSESG